MEEKQYIGYVINYKEEEIVSIEELISNPENYKIRNITISQDEDYNHKKGLVRIINTDYEHPLKIEKEILSDGLYLYINKEYFNKNKEKIIELIKHIFKNTKEQTVSLLNKEFITEEILSIIAKNENINKIILKDPNEVYELTIPVFELFKKANKEVSTRKICKELEENFDETITYNQQRNLIGYLNYKSLQVFYLNLKI